MDSDSFTIVADRLCELSDLDRLEARGTIRLAFKRAGVNVSSFGLDDLAAVFAKIMPDELAARGCTNAQAICEAIMASLDGSAVPATAEGSRDEIMRRLGSG
jgi:hypothetical protein